MKKQTVVQLTVIALITLFAAGALFMRQRQARQKSFLASENAQVFVPDGAITYGSDDARVIITEWTDPACGTCAQLFKPVEKLVDDHPGQVRLVIRHAALHQNSDQIVKMLLAARAQGKYFEALELVFATQSQWTINHVAQPQVVMGLLPRVGIDMDALRTALSDPALDQELVRDMADAQTVGVEATPEYYVNGQPLPTWGYEQLVTLVNHELAVQYP